MDKALKIIQKLIIPILLAIILYVTSNANNKILSQQNRLIEIQTNKSNEHLNRQLELKYLELFYNDINSDNPQKQSNAIGLIRLMNPELGIQLSEWTIKNVNLSAQSQGKVTSIGKELSEILNANTHTKRGIELARNGKFENAIKEYKKAIKLNSNDYKLYNYLGYSYYRIDKLDNAEKSIRKSIEINENAILPHYNLSLVLWKLGKIEESLDELEFVIKLDNNYINIIKGDAQFNNFNSSPRFRELIK